VSSARVELFAADQDDADLDPEVAHPTADATEHDDGAGGYEALDPVDAGRVREPRGVERPQVAEPAPDDMEVPAWRDEVERPYDAWEARGALEERYPSQVRSTTVPRPTDLNVHLAGGEHPVTRIPFNERGFPVFDGVALCDIRIAPDQALIRDRPSHFREATARLREDIDAGRVPAGEFTDQQLAAIDRGLAKIPGLTWHHHQDVGRLQLVPTDIHNRTNHIGGFKMWFGV
jgi:hypothetical protein